MSHGKGDIISAIKEHIDIPDYLESCGYHIRKHGSKGKLTLKEHDSFVYDPARKRFYWNSRDLEGDIVDLYGYLNNCDFDTAIRALRAMLPARTHQASRPSTSAILRPGVTKSAPFSPPKPAPQNLKYVYAYLINTRSISPTVVKWLVKQHYIYADAKRNLCYISPGYGTDRPYVGQKGTWVDSETGNRHIFGVLWREATLRGVFPSIWCAPMARRLVYSGYLYVKQRLIFSVSCPFWNSTRGTLRNTATSAWNAAMKAL